MPPPPPPPNPPLQCQRNILMSPRLDYPKNTLLVSPLPWKNTLSVVWHWLFLKNKTSKTVKADKRPDVWLTLGNVSRSFQAIIEFHVKLWDNSSVERKKNLWVDYLNSTTASSKFDPKRAPYSTETHPPTQERHGKWTKSKSLPL